MYCCAASVVLRFWYLIWNRSVRVRQLGNFLMNLGIPTLNDGVGFNVKTSIHEASVVSKMFVVGKWNSQCMEAFSWQKVWGCIFRNLSSEVFNKPVLQLTRVCQHYIILHCKRFLSMTNLKAFSNILHQIKNHFCTLNPRLTIR